VPAMHLRVRGRVQGIGFRWFVRVHARRLGLAGWVANDPDGSVEIAALGDQAKLDDLKRAVERGPDGALVEALDELPPVENLAYPFAVRR
jgi:acylphosphatase